jgi:hypothetical protein
MSDTTQDRLAQIAQRAEAATEGPWVETWKQIPGCDGYEVSDFGNVRSYYRKGNHKEKRSPHPRTLARRDSASGYPSVSLPVDGSYRTRRIHRLVMEAFVGPAPAGMEVAHLNGDRTDARLANLRYVTHQENEAHKAAHGTSGVGERNSGAQMQGWQVAEVKYLAGKSVPQGKIAALFGISHKQVSAILNGRAWADEAARTDIPAMHAALTAVLALHVEGRAYGVRVCMTCSQVKDADEWDDPADSPIPSWLPYPCPTVRAINDALGGE